MTEEIMSSQALEFEVKKPPQSVALATPNPFALFQQALAQGMTLEQMQVFQAMCEKHEASEAQKAFNEAMNLVQAEIGRIAPDLTNPQTKSKYASYAALDRVVRPIYTKHGFSLSFDEADCDKPEHVRVVCYCSHKDGHTRTYHKDIPADGKGAKGGDVMTKTHASGAADTYGMRYVLKKIFNIAIGEDDTDGNIPGMEDVSERVEFIHNCRDFAELKVVFADAYKAAKVANDTRAQKTITSAYEAKKRELNANR